MSEEYENLYSFIEHCNMLRVCVTQNPGGVARTLEVELESSPGCVRKLRFENPNDIDSLGELLECRRLWVEKDFGTQKDFDSIRLSFFAEGFVEIFCDSVLEM